MEETNFIHLWKEQYKDSDQAVTINQQLLKELINHKAQSTLKLLTWFKIKGIIAAIIYLILLATLLFYAISDYSPAADYFIISMTAIFIINVKALADYIKHLVWIHDIDYNGALTSIQSKLVRLQLSILRHSRFMVLQFPFWTTFYLSNRWFPHFVSWGFIIFQISFTALSTYLSYWLYTNHTLENINKKWIRTLIEGSGGKSVAKAIDFYHELENFVREI